MTHDGVFYRVESGDASDFHNNLPAMKADINNMRVIHTGEQKWFKREDKWSIRECFGFTEVLVHGGKKEHKEVDKLKIKEKQYLIMPVPFIRVPDAHGILLALGDFNYEGTLELWDPYEGQGDIRENYPYAPVTYTTASGKEIQLDRKIATVNIGSNLPDFAIAWAVSMGGYDPLITYEEPDKLWGGMYHPDYPWYSDAFENFYGVSLGTSRDSWSCTDDGNWSGSQSSWITFLGEVVSDVAHYNNTAVDHMVTSQGDEWSIVAYTPASNYSNKWACIAKYVIRYSLWEWYPGFHFCGAPPGYLGMTYGTNEYQIEYSSTTQYIYMDYTGARIVLDTIADTRSVIGAGLVKMYEFGDRTVFCFNFYCLTTGSRMAGLVENGQGAVTDITNMIDKDGNNYAQPLGQNHVGLVLFKYLAPHERIVDVY